MTSDNSSDSAVIEITDRTKYLKDCAKILAQLLGEAYGRGSKLPALDDLADMGADLGLDSEDARACVGILRTRYAPMLRGWGYSV